MTNDNFSMRLTRGDKDTLKKLRTYFEKKLRIKINKTLLYRLAINELAELIDTNK